MVFPQEHNYLTVHFAHTEDNELAQFGMRFDGAAQPTQQMVTAAAGVVQTWFLAATMGFCNKIRLDFVRAARLGVDGKYLPGTTSIDHVYPAGVLGPVAANPFFPWSTAMVVSLETALPRGRAHQGKIYSPAPQLGLTGNATWAVSGALTSMNNTTSEMLDDLSDVGLGTLCVLSKVGAGAKQIVTGCKIGSRPDVQRRRNKQQVESYTPTTNFPP